MCDASKLAGLQLGGTGLRAGTQIMQARYEMAAMRQNEILAERQAQRALEAGAAEYTELKADGERVVGSQRAALAGGGVQAGTSRSALDLLSETAETADKDAGTSLDNAGMTADALKTEASHKRASRKTLGRFAPLAVGSGLLTGGARAYGIYKKAGG